MFQNAKTAARLWLSMQRTSEAKAAAPDFEQRGEGGATACLFAGPFFINK